MVWHRDLALLYTIEGAPPLRVLAVGWLGFFTLRRGATPSRFQELLAELCRRPPEATRTAGFHPCRLGPCLWRWWSGRGHYGGSAEILVPGRGENVYRSPTLIAHYVSRHRYRPPQEFVEAVLALDRPGGLNWEVIQRLTGPLWPDR